MFTNTPIESVHVLTTQTQRLLPVHLRLRRLQPLLLALERLVVLKHLVDDHVQLRRSLRLLHVALVRVLPDHFLLLFLLLSLRLRPLLLHQLLLLRVPLLLVAGLHRLPHLLHLDVVLLSTHTTMIVSQRLAVLTLVRVLHVTSLSKGHCFRGDHALLFLFVLSHIFQLLRKHD